MAAGEGRRMRPLTYEIPKPMVPVNGTRMIDTVIRGLHQNGITEIYVVVGYLKEQFKCLEQDYTGLQLIDNPWYDTCNNISSLYAAREHLEDCMILDGDQIVFNPAALDPHFVRSGYNAVWTETQTDEWLMQVEDGIVTACSRTGGDRGWQLYSISRWTKQDGRRLKNYLEEEFENGNRQVYWDDVAMFLHPQDFELGVFKMQRSDVAEIDSLEELAAADDSYKKYLNAAETAQ